MPGLLLLIVAGIGLVALVVDTLAAGLDLPGMTLIPLAALFVVPWAINRGSAPWWTFAVVAAGLAGASCPPSSGERAVAVEPRCAGRLPRDRPGHRRSHHRAGPARRWADDPAWAGRTRRHRAGVGRRDGGGRRAGLAAPIAGEQRHPAGDHPGDHRHPTRLPPAVRSSSCSTASSGSPSAPTRPARSRPPAPTAASPRPISHPGSRVAEYQLDVGPLGGTTLPSPSGSYLSLTDWPVVWDQRTSLPLRADGDTVEGARISLVATAQDLDADGLRAASTVPPRARAGVRREPRRPDPAHR